MKYIEFFKTLDTISNIEDIINELDRLTLKCYEYYQNSSFQDEDVRKKIFYNLALEIQNLNITFYLSKNISDSVFPFDNLILEQRLNLKNAYLDSSKDNLVFKVFAYTEAYLREIAKVKDIKNEKILKIVEKIVELSEFNLTNEDLNLWKIFSYLRNSFHNTGFFRYNDESLQYKNKAYFFLKNCPIEYASIIDIIYFVEEIIEEIILKINLNSKDIDYIQSREANVVL